MKKNNEPILVNFYDSQAHDKRELDEKRDFVNKTKINQEYEELKSAEYETLAIQNLKIEKEPSHEQILAMQKNNDEYFDDLKKSPSFLTGALAKEIPMTPKSIVVVAGVTGEGKSTTTANIAHQNRLQGKRTLIISNEELSYDIYNRITCLQNGWAYNDHKKFTDAQITIFSQNIPILSQHIHIIDSNYSQGAGLTSTVEGLEKILTEVKDQGFCFDAILIDYYQNVTEWLADPTADDWKSQKKFATFLDKYKNSCPIPIVMMAQCKPMNKIQDNVALQARWIGSKHILLCATSILEVKPVPSKFLSYWIIHKSRFGKKSEGKGIPTGFDSGLYVPYDDEFRAKAEKWIRNKSTGEKKNE